MSEKMGIDEVVACADLVLTGVGIVKSAEADGHLGVEDLALLLQLIPAVTPVVAGMGNLIPELKDLSVDEAGALAAHVMAKLGVASPKALAIADAALKVAVASYGLFEALKEPAAPTAPAA